MAGYGELRAEQSRRRESGEGKLLGIGLSSYIEACGIAPSQVVGALGAQAGLWESAKVRVHPTGTVTVFTGSSAHGQGHETTFAQIVADRLGIDMEKIDIVHGDTGEVQFGMGTYGSRSAAVGGSAIAVAVDKAIEKGKKIAAHLLEAAEEDVEFADGKYAVRGVPDKAKSWGDVALQAYLAHNLPDGMEPGLEETAFYNPANFVYPFGTHVAVVEIDRDTGEVELARYVAVDDFGNVINPMIVDGQIHGGIAQGVGQALWEEAVYDEQGQLVTATLLDYAMPRAHRLPSFELDAHRHPLPAQPAGGQGRWRGGHHRLAGGGDQRGGRRPGALRGAPPRHAADPGEGLARDAPGREGLMFPASSTITARRAWTRPSSCWPPTRAPRCWPAATA